MKKLIQALRNVFAVIGLLVVIVIIIPDSVFEETPTNSSHPAPPNESVPAEASSTARKPLNGDVAIDLTVTELPDRRIRLHGTTNLPEWTNLSLSVEERMENGFRGQSQCSVADDGSFESEAFGPSDGLKDGLYVAKVVMPIPRVQPDDVKEIIGVDGENLSGPLVEKGSFGVTLSTKKKFTIGGDQAAQAQQQRVKDAEESIANLKLEVCVQLERLLAFKDKQDFKTYGFGAGGPYGKWMKDVEALRDSHPKGAHPIPLMLRAAPGDLLMLGKMYMRNHRDTNPATYNTRQALSELQQTIGYADYLTTKSQRDQNDR